MAEYIEREALLLSVAGVKVHMNGKSDWIKGYRDALQAMGEFVQEFPAADVVEVDALKAWLYEMAMNNTDNCLCTACEEIISRLDGLRVFAKERRTEDGRYMQTVAYAESASQCHAFEFVQDGQGVHQGR